VRRLRIFRGLGVAGVIALAVFLAMGKASAQGVLYGAAHSGKAAPSTLYRIDKETGAWEEIGPIIIGEGVEGVGGIPVLEVTGMDADPSGRLYATGVNS